VQLALAACCLVGCAAPGRVTPLRTVFPVTTPLPDTVASASVPLAVEEFSASVDVVVGDAPARSFKVDTGAQMCALPRSWALELGLPMRSVFGSLAGATSTEWGWHQIARIERLSIGDVVFEGLHAFVIDDAFLSKPLLGFRVFEDLVVTLDFPRAQLTMRPQHAISAGATDVPGMRFRLRSDVPEIEVVMDGRPLSVVLDTGLGDALRLPTRFERLVELESPPEAVRTARTVNSFAVTRMARASGDLHLASYRLHRPIVSFGPGDALLGFGALRSFALTFDLRRRSIRFEAVEPQAVIQSPSIYGFGFILAQEGERRVVDSVYPGGPAERAGLLVGDTITGIGATAAVRSTPRSVTLTVRRDGERHVIHIEHGVVVE